MAAKLPNGLTVKEDNFARNVAAGMDMGAAAAAAGYSQKSAGQAASALLKRPDIIERITALNTKAAERAEIDAAFVYDNIREIASKGLAMIPVTDRSGNVICEKPTDLSAAARATEMAAKLLGMMVERHAVEMSEDVRKTLDRIINVLTTEIEDPAVLERIMKRLSDDGPAATRTN